MSIENVYALLALLATGIGGVTAAWMNNSSKIDRTYERMDEHKEQFYKDFVLKSTLESDLKYLKEINEQKHDGLNDLVKEKLDNLTAKIDEQSVQIRLLTNIINKQKGE